MQVAQRPKCESRAKFEDALVELIKQGRIGYVRVSLYRAPPTEDGLVPQFYVPSGEYLRDVFARLDETGALRV